MLKYENLWEPKITFCYSQGFNYGMIGQYQSTPAKQDNIVLSTALAKPFLFCWDYCVFKRLFVTKSSAFIIHKVEPSIVCCLCVVLFFLNECFVLFLVLFPFVWIYLLLLSLLLVRVFQQHTKEIKKNN